MSSGNFSENHTSSPIEILYTTASTIIILKIHYFRTFCYLTYSRVMALVYLTESKKY